MTRDIRWELSLDMDANVKTIIRGLESSMMQRIEQSHSTKMGSAKVLHSQM